MDTATPTTETTPSGKKLFAIGEGCSQQQREVFEAINTGLKKLDMSADEFDAYFRVELMRRSILVGRDSSPAYLEALQKRNAPHDRAFLQRTAEIFTAGKKLRDDYFGVPVEAVLKHNLPNDRDKAALTGEIIGRQKTYMEHFCAMLNTHLGRFQDIDPAQFTDSDSLKTIAAFEENVPKILRPRPAVTPGKNLLQEYADGKDFFAHAQLSWNENDKIKFMISDIAEHKKHSLAATFLDMAKASKGWNMAKAKSELGDVIGVIRNSEIGATRDKGITAIPSASALPTPVVSDALNPEEKAFFAALDKVEKLTLNTPVNFDYNIRNRLTMLVANSGSIAVTRMAKKINDIYGTDHPTDMVRRGTSSLFEELYKLPISVQSTDGPREPDKFKKGVYSPAPALTQINNRLIAHISDRIPGLMEQRVYPNGPVYEEKVAEGVALMERQFAGVVGYKDYDPANPLMAQYRDGRKSLRDLSGDAMEHQWKHFKVQLPSEREYFITALKVAARLTLSYKGSQNAGQKQKLETAIVEMEAAFKRATMTPEQLAADNLAKQEAEARKAEEEKKRADDAAKLRAEQEKEAARIREEKAAAAVALLAQQALAAAVAFTAFRFMGYPQSVLDRGIDSRPLLQDVVQREILPIKDALNQNFEPHKALGNALFTDGNSQALRVVDSICTDAKMPARNPAVTAAIAQNIKNVLGLTLDDSPKHQANKERQGQVTAALAHAPVLIIAGLGDDKAVAEVKKIQQALFPLRKKEQLNPEATAEQVRRRAELAGEVLTQHGIEVPEALKAAGTKPPQDPPKPPPRNLAAGPVPPWDDIETRVKDFLLQHLKDKPPYTLFSSRLKPDPNYHLIVTISRWVQHNGALRVDSRNTDIDLGCAETAEALAIRERVQDMVLSERPYMPNRKLHGTPIGVFAQTVLPNVAPVRDQVTGKEGVWQLQLRFETPSKGPTTAPVVTEAFIPLGLPLRATGSAQEANLRAQRVRDYLQQVRNTPPEEEQRLVTEQHVRDWLENSVRRDPDPAHNTWRGAEYVDMSAAQYSKVVRETVVDFPAGSGDGTKIKIGNPVNKGIPTGDWKIPVTYSRMVPQDDGSRVEKEIYTAQINTHHGTGQGAVDCIPGVLSHMKRHLEAYGQQHKTAQWKLKPDGFIDQEKYTAESPKTVDVDYTKLRWMQAMMEFPCGLSTQARDMSSYEGDVTKGMAKFNVAVVQADGPDFQRRTDTIGQELTRSLQGECVIDEPGLAKAEVERRMQLFGDAVQKKFDEVVKKHFAPRRGAATTSPAVDFPPTDKDWQAVAYYQPATVIKWFEAVFNETLARADMKGLNIKGVPGMAAPGAGGGADLPQGGPKFRHMPNEQDLQSLKPLRGIKRRDPLERGDGFTLN